MPKYEPTLQMRLVNGRFIPPNGRLSGNRNGCTPIEGKIFVVPKSAADFPKRILMVYFTKHSNASTVPAGYRARSEARKTDLVMVQQRRPPPWQLTQ